MMTPHPGCNCRYADVGCDKMEQVMDQLSGKWKLRILFMVGAHGTLRYGELRGLLGNVTHKMLSNQLKELAADGLVARRDYGEVPPRVEYSLTPRGNALMPILTTSAATSCAMAPGRKFARSRTISID